MSYSCELETPDLPPHVLIFPVPLQGHLNGMLDLAHLFCLRGLHVTFIVSDHSHRRLLHWTAAGFQFRAFPDGLPEDHPRAGERVLDVVPSVVKEMVPLFREMMIREDMLASRRRRAVSCIVADGLLSFAADYAAENGLPLIYFRTTSAANFWTCFHLDRLIEARQIPFAAENMDALVESAPAGMEGVLRLRDLPGHCRVTDINDPFLRSISAVTRRTVGAAAAIFNTFEDLEGPTASLIQKHMPRTFTIGPIHGLLRSRLLTPERVSIPSSHSLWAEDRSCITWLDAQPPKSVVYVSFGSVAVVTREQLLEFWHGLVNSGQRFLWVMRPDSVVGRFPEEVMEGAEERGCLVEWAPQEEVLNHPAVGGFLTHSGWNSTLEGITAGVPMICWPYFGDQMINSRFVSEVWKIGLDIKDTCDSLIIEKAVKEVMEVRKEEFLERAGKLAKLAKEAVSEGGSSYCNMDGLIKYIISLVI